MSEDPADKTAEKPRGRPFEPGNRANPAGRPKGARNKLGEQFLEDMLADWQEHGVAVIATVRAEKPDVYVKVVASILPKELNVKVSELDELSDDQLNKRIRQLAAALEIGIGEAASGGQAPEGSTTAH